MSLSSLVSELGVAAGSGLQMWALAGPLVGVLVGGITAGAFSLWVSTRAHKHARARDVVDLRRTEYFDAIDATQRARRALHQFASDLSERWEPDADDHSPQAEEMRRRDEEGPLVFDRLDAAIVDMRRTTLRVRAVGSPQVSGSIEAIDKLMGDYFIGVAREADEHNNGMPVFRAAAFDSLMVDFTKAAEKLSDDIRSDLEIDRVYAPRASRRRA